MGTQFLDLEWPGDEIVGAGVQRFDGADWVYAARQGQNGHLAATTQAFDY